MGISMLSHALPPRQPYVRASGIQRFMVVNLALKIFD